MLKTPGLEWQVTEVSWKPVKGSRFGLGLKGVLWQID